MDTMVGSDCDGNYVYERLKEILVGEAIIMDGYCYTGWRL